MTSLKLEQQLKATANHTHIAYRQDIDGLRAVAVIAVVLFHAFPSFLKGGFIGVDIFFVISGFLISSILIRELKADAFSIAKFYARRVTRIFPALIAVLIACLVFGWLALLSEEYKSLAKHALAGAGFVSNLVFWSETSYFDVASEAKPLLHLWSLGVEEQFYLLWPLLLLLFVRLRANVPLAICATIAVSFGLNLFQATHNPTADFYSPLTRVWELLAGALIACTPSHWKPSFRVANALSCVGTALIVAGLITITSANVFPGTLALVPVTGAALLIAAGPQGLINRIVLSNRLMVGIGLISFPLYLWHWPLLSFPRIIESATPSTSIRIAAVLITILLSWLTYKFIETPIRTGAISRAKSVKYLSCAMLAIATAAILIFAKDGLADRAGANPIARYPNDLGRDPYLAYISSNFSRCSNIELRELSSLDASYGYRCFQSKPDMPIKILLVGDSHAEHWLPGIAEQFIDVNVGSFIQPQLPSLDSPAFKAPLDLISKDSNMEIIIISAMWIDKIAPGLIEPEKQMSQTLEMLSKSGKHIYVMDDIPAFPFDPEKCKYGRRFSSSTSKCEMSLSDYQNQKKYYSTILLSALKQNPNVKFIRAHELLCDTKFCTMRADGKLLYRDTNHLNIDGSKYLADKLVSSGRLLK
jgi:peptidoglycan/LPS O-acetylase OafA/YrhL